MTDKRQSGPHKAEAAKDLQGESDTVVRDPKTGINRDMPANIGDATGKNRDFGDRFCQ